MYSSMQLVPEHTHIDIAYGAGNQVVNNKNTLKSDNNYYSANEHRMEVDDSHKEMSCCKMVSNNVRNITRIM